MSKTNIYEVIKKTAEQVREQIMFESGNDPTGYCVEASELIIEELKQEGISAKLIEGWVQYDNPSSCSDRDYDEHTWVECEGYIIDVTGDQFDYYMDEPMPPVYIEKELPYGWLYDEPEEEEDYQLKKEVNKMKQVMIWIHTEGYFNCHVIADSEEEALEIGEEMFNEADFNDLKEVEFISSSADDEGDGTWDCTFSVMGRFECILDVKRKLTEDELIQTAEEENWQDADFGPLEDAEISYSNIVDEWEV